MILNTSFLNLLLFCTFPVSDSKLWVLKVIICVQHCCCLQEPMGYKSQLCKFCNALYTSKEWILSPKEKEQKNQQLPEPELVSPPVNLMMQKQHLISTTKSLIMKFRPKLWQKLCCDYQYRPWLQQRWENQHGSCWCTTRQSWQYHTFTQISYLASKMKN